MQAGKDSVGDTVASVRDSVRNATTAAGEAATSRFSAASDHMGHSAERLRDSGAELSRHASELARNALAFCKEQPLVLAGLGIALGAAIGAAFPPTRVENDFMGEASDDLKEKLVRAKEGVTQTARDIADAAGDQGSNDEKALEINAQSSNADDRMVSASAPARVS